MSFVIHTEMFNVAFWFNAVDDQRRPLMRIMPLQIPWNWIQLLWILGLGRTEKIT